VTENILPPFSARNRGAFAQIDNECPQTTRNGLLHLVRALVEKEYVGNWDAVLAELRRIGRAAIGDESSAEELIMQLDWPKVFDFCERLYGHLARDVYEYNSFAGTSQVITARSEAQEYIAKELRQLFLEENLALEFSGGVVRRRGRRHTAEQVARAEVVLGDPRLAKARTHFNKALKYFRNVSEPDYENTCKEAVCSVEATARVLFPDGGATLGDIASSITGNQAGQLPKAIAKTFHGLYGFRGSGEGVAHGGADGGPATKEIAEYVMAVAASQIVFLVALDANAEPDVPV
jgi:hypothetical protein